MRNFYVNGKVRYPKTLRDKNFGGTDMSLVLSVLLKGESHEVLHIDCKTLESGNKDITIYDKEGIVYAMTYPKD